MKTQRSLAAGLTLALLFTACGDDDSGRGILAPEDRLAHSVSSVLISGPPKRSREEARLRAWELWKMIMDGSDFAKVAEQNSDDDSRIDGGFLGFLPTHHDTSLAGALQALRPGDISPPVWTAIGYQILKRHSFDEAVRMEKKLWVWAYGIYISWSMDGGRTKEEARQLAERVLAQLRNGEITLPEARKKYSSDKRLRPDAFLGPTASRPARQGLFDALAAVKEGEYAGPLDTQHGWAVLWRGYYLRALVKHILIQHSGIDLTVHRAPAEAEALAKRLHGQLSKDPGRWSELVKNFSDDGSTRGNDGLMPSITPGSMPLTFENMVRKTGRGQLAPAPVWTDDGWHIIYRLK